MSAQRATGSPGELRQEFTQAQKGCMAWEGASHCQCCLTPSST